MCGAEGFLAAKAPEVSETWAVLVQIQRAPKEDVMAKNRIKTVGPGILAIELTQGLLALIDEQDLKSISDYRWFAQRGNSTFYAQAHTRTRDGRETKIRMHRLLIEVAECVDHVNGDGLDNRRSNLRAASKSQNGMNRSVSRVSSSGLKGVYLHKLTGKWQAKIEANGKQNHLGLFTTRKAAASAYDDAAKKLHGRFARRNCPNE